MVASLLVGLLICGLVYWWFQAVIAGQQDRNALLQREITVLEGQIKEIALIESEIAALRARQKAVEDLQSDRNMPVHLLNEIVRQIPDGVYLTSMRQMGRQWCCKARPNRTNAFRRCCAISVAIRHGCPSPSWWKSSPARSI